MLVDRRNDLVQVSLNLLDREKPLALTFGLGSVEHRKEIPALLLNILKQAEPGPRNLAHAAVATAADAGFGESLEFRCKADIRHECQSMTSVA